MRSAYHSQPQYVHPIQCFSGRVRTVRLSTLPCQVSLISPPNRMCGFHRVRLSSFPLALSSCQVLSVVYLGLALCDPPILLTIGKPAGLRPVRGFPALRGQAVTPADYCASSVARLIFRLFSHSHLWLSDWGNPRLAIQPVALDLGGPFRSFIPYWVCVP